MCVCVRACVCVGGGQAAARDCEDCQDAFCCDCYMQVHPPGDQHKYRLILSECVECTIATAKYAHHCLPAAATPALCRFWDTRELTRALRARAILQVAMLGL